MVRNSRRLPASLADDRVCQSAADLIIFLDSLSVKRAITTNSREWAAFDGIAGVRVITFRKNPQHSNPAPFEGCKDG